jgi:hypothetical protein
VAGDQGAQRKADMQNQRIIAPRNAAALRNRARAEEEMWTRGPSRSNANGADRMELLSSDELRCLKEWLAVDQETERR